LIAANWSIGARYRLSDSRLDQRFSEIAPGALLDPPTRSQQNLEATLHELDTHLAFTHSSGIFLQAQALWFSQDNSGYDPALAGDSFWQANIVAGYRFPRRNAEISIGVLNLSDEDYRLNPLTPYLELPRRRTLMVRFRLSL